MSLDHYRESVWAWRQLFLTTPDPTPMPWRDIVGFALTIAVLVFGACGVIFFGSY